MAAAPKNFYAYSGKTSGAAVVVSSGDLICVFYSSQDSLVSPTISDGVNSYTMVGSGSYQSTSDVSVYCWYAIAASSTTLTITVTDAASNTPGLFVCTGTGTATSSYLGNYAFMGVDTAGTTHNSGTITTTSGDLVFSFWSTEYNSGSIAENGKGFTLQKNLTATVYAASLSQVIAGTSIFDSVTTSASNILNGIIVAFHAASGGSYQPYWMMPIFD